MWPRIVNAGLGLWLMAAPDVLGFEGAARINCLVAGPIAASFAIIAMSEATRPLRWVNGVVGVWLLLSAFIVTGERWVATINGAAVGLLLLLFSMVRGTLKAKLGGGWSAVLRRN